jgi:hypothetical protein
VVEWITLAMFGAFAYAVGFMIPLIVTYFANRGARFCWPLVLGRRQRDLRRDDPVAAALIQKGPDGPMALDLRLAGDDIGLTISPTPR